MRLGLVVAVTAVIAVPTALGASSQDIAKDLADGRLDGQYTQAELEAFRENATLQVYGNPAAKVTPPAEGAVAGARDVQEVETLPFTGVDLALLVGGGALILAIGLSVRRLARDKS